MENLDVMVLRALCGWRQAGRRALLATVVRTWGSSPRPVGSIMALSEDGAVLGSVSGGCIEDDLIFRFTRAYASDGAAPSDGVQQIPSGPPQRVKYGVTADEAHRFGLPCGGTLELLLEFDPDATCLAELVVRLEQGQLVRRTVRLADGVVGLQPASTPAALAVSDAELANTFGPEYRLLIIGAGQLSEYVATMAQFSGFAVTVCDPREEYRGAWAVPGVTVSSGMPDEVVTAFKPDSRSCVIALTHDPKLDDLALLEALQSDAFYIGAIGSRRNSLHRRERLRTHFDVPEAALQSLHGPAGLYIGSKTPAEIALSILAEVVAVKNGVQLPAPAHVAVGKSQHEVSEAPETPGLDGAALSGCAV